MSAKAFEIKILDLHWIANFDDPNDLCAHGHLYIKIGDQILANKESGDWTLSSTALYLMRAISENYRPGDYGSQIVPCCGHLMFINKNSNKVSIMGCERGIDWTIVHKGNQIELITEAGNVTNISKDEFKAIVFDFVDLVELFYNSSVVKILPDDQSDRMAYKLFWKEWRKLRGM